MKEPEQLLEEYEYKRLNDDGGITGVSVQVIDTPILALPMDTTEHALGVHGPLKPDETK